MDDQGLWQEHLWLDELVLPAMADAAENGRKREKIKLTDPLPINNCSADSLTLLPGVGKVMAQRIDVARRQGLVFTCAADLRKIKGIGAILSARLDTLVVYQLHKRFTTLKPDTIKLFASP